MQLVLTFDGFDEMEAFCRRVVSGAPVAEAVKPAKKAAKEEAPAVKEEAPAAKEEEAPAAKETAEITVETVREKLGALQKNGKREEVKALIRSFGVKSLPEISPEDYAELLRKAEEL